MIRTVLKVAVAAAAMMTAAQASAQTSATVSDTTGSTTIIAPISLTRAGNLSFGTVTRPTSGSALVKITPAGALTVDGGGAVTAGGTATVPTYTVGGENNKAFNITMGPLSMAGPTGSTAIAVTLAHSLSTGTPSGTLSSSGSATFTVGGEFTITPSTVVGTYSGTFPVTVTYN